MKRKVNFIIIILVLFISLVTNVRALDNTIDLSKKGTISVTLKEKETNTLINGAEITIYHVGNAGIKDNNLVFNKREELTCDVNLDDLKDIELVNDIAKCINENTIKYVKTTNNGKVTFSNLEQGLYLVSQTTSVEGYSDIDPFLVAIPKVEDSIWIYDINALPKTDIYRIIDLVVEKKWNTVSKNIPKYVSVELYKDNELIETIQLNEENNWTYIFKGIEKSDKYIVKEINIPKGFTPSYKVDEYIFTITNSDILADTGQIFYPIIILFFAGLIFIIFGIKIIKEA